MAWNRRTRGEKWLLALALIACILSALFALGKDAIQANRQADAAIFEQLTENISKGKGAVSSIFAASQNFIEKKYIYQSTGDLLGQTLTPPAEKERNMLGFHAYWILFALAPFVHFVGSSLLLTSVQTACFIGLLLGACRLVKKETGQWSAPLLFMPFLLFSPNWLGGMIGQFYPDRIFVFAAFLLCWALYYNARPILLILAAVLVASINERAALIGGAICLFMPFCRDSKNTWLRQYALPISIGLLMLTYSYVERKFFLSNLYYDSFLPASLKELYQRFFLEGFALHSLIFILANGALLVFAFFNPRLGALALIVMMPNLIGNIGGGEKIGWRTHYHSYYFPILVFAASVGFSELVKNHRRSPKFLPILFIVFVISFGILKREVNIGNAPPTHRFKGAFNSAFDLLAGRPTGYQTKSRLIAQIPAGSKVSTDELGAALIGNHALIDMFPVSSDKADYLFLLCDWMEDAGGESGEKPVLSREWLREHDFDIDKTTRFPGMDRQRYCLIPRAH